MSDLRFLRPQSEVDLRQMPGKDRQKIEMAIFMCRANGSVPMELLQVGLAILRSLSLEEPVEDEQPIFWAFVGLVEWIDACSPEEDSIRMILCDLRILCPHTPGSARHILKQVVNKNAQLQLAAMKIELLLNR